MVGGGCSFWRRSIESRMLSLTRPSGDPVLATWYIRSENWRRVPRKSRRSNLLLNGHASSYRGNQGASRGLLCLRGENRARKTLLIWLDESSIEKKRGFDPFRNLLLCYLSGERSEVMKRLSLRSVKPSCKKRQIPLACCIHLRKTIRRPASLRLSKSSRLPTT